MDDENERNRPSDLGCREATCAPYLVSPEEVVLSAIETQFLDDGGSQCDCLLAFVAMFVGFRWELFLRASAQVAALPSHSRIRWA